MRYLGHLMLKQKRLTNAQGSGMAEAALVATRHQECIVFLCFPNFDIV